LITLPSRLRPYQLEAGRAIVDSVVKRRGLTFSVEIARQGGKNELSARVELALLLASFRRDVSSIKAAPTLRPQAQISFRRLWRSVHEAGLAGWAVRENGNCIRIGRARQLFLSAAKRSNIVGHTADLLLEIDEAQDVDVDKFDKELRPMAANSGATTVFYGTAWDEANLLERSKQAHLEAEQRDGVRRHFEYDWQVVAACNPPYEAYVAAERDRLGADHPMFLTQYCLQPLPGAGRLFGPTQLSLLRGSYARLDAPLPGEAYIAALDVAGEASEAAGAATHDATVLTIGRVAAADDDSPLRAPAVEVVRHYAWTGVRHVELYGALVSLLRETWRVRRLVVDATGIGEPVAAFLQHALGLSRVESLKLTTASKSQLGYALLEAVNAGRLRLYEDPAAPELRECRRQMERCRAVYRPNGSLGFFVETRDGHDDYVISLALLVAAAAAGLPRRARGRQREE
jgi:hypothetical protein